MPGAEAPAFQCTCYATARKRKGRHDLSFVAEGALGRDLRQNADLPSLACAQRHHASSAHLYIAFRRPPHLQECWAGERARPRPALVNCRSGPHYCAEVSAT